MDIQEFYPNLDEKRILRSHTGSKKEYFGRKVRLSKVQKNESGNI
jgi:hypothetical protein